MNLNRGIKRIVFCFAIFVSFVGAFYAFSLTYGKHNSAYNNLAQKLLEFRNNYGTMEVSLDDMYGGIWDLEVSTMKQRKLDDSLRRIGFFIKTIGSISSYELETNPSSRLNRDVERGEIKELRRNFWIASPTIILGMIFILAMLSGAGFGYCAVWAFYGIILYIAKGFVEEINTKENKHGQ